jgi:phytoene dehydrogenase-like protein
MSQSVIVVGAGMGGLMAALRLAQRGWRVQVVEARTTPGGLAAGLATDGFDFDGGPYILLDRRGLDWAFEAVGLSLSELIDLHRLDPVYEVISHEGTRCRFYADAQRTATEFDQTWPGSGQQYLRFVGDTATIYERLAPLLRISQPSLVDLLRTGAWRAAPFLLHPLGRVLAKTGLPQPIQAAIAIWTHVAGQQTGQAPSPLAFVPALIHNAGAWLPRGGIGVIPQTLAQRAAAAGASFRYGATVRTIRTQAGCVIGVELEGGEFLPADAVVSNAPGLATYLNLVKTTPSAVRARLQQLPRQSPGVCAYLAVRGGIEPPYLRFLLPANDALCRLLVRPGVVDETLAQDGWQPARLIAPMRYEEAEELGPAGQAAFVDQLLAEDWWRTGISDVRLLATRTPATWGADFHLYAHSMNPVMTARSMRTGRLAHRSPYVRGLYLAGSATHPGQWVSFCALSGILAADCLYEDTI